MAIADARRLHRHVLDVDAAAIGGLQHDIARLADTGQAGAADEAEAMGGIADIARRRQGHIAAAGANRVADTLNDDGTRARGAGVERQIAGPPASTLSLRSWMVMLWATLTRKPAPFCSSASSLCSPMPLAVCELRAIANGELRRIDIEQPALAGVDRAVQADGLAGDLDIPALAAAGAARRRDEGQGPDRIGAAGLGDDLAAIAGAIAARRHLAADIHIARGRHQHRAALTVRRKRIRVHDPVQVHNRIDHFAGDAGRDQDLARTRLQRAGVVDTNSLAVAHDLLDRTRRHDEVDQARAGEIQRELVRASQRDRAQISLDEARVLHIRRRQDRKAAIGDGDRALVDHSPIARAAVARSLRGIAIHRHRRRREQGADIDLRGPGEGDARAVQDEDAPIGVQRTGEIGGNPAHHPVDRNRRAARLIEIDRLAGGDREVLPVDVQDVALLIDISRCAVRRGDRALAAGDLAARGTRQRHTACPKQDCAAEQHHQTGGDFLALLVAPPLPAKLDLAFAHVEVVHRTHPQY